MSGSDSPGISRMPVAVLAIVGALSFTMPAFADSYTYDAQGRLVTVLYDDGSSITYAYDAAGNRTVLTQTSAPG